MSKRKQATLGEFGFSKKVYHRDGEVDVIIPEFVEEKEIVCWKNFRPQIVLIFRAISASMFLLSLFLSKKTVYSNTSKFKSKVSKPVERTQH